MDDRRPSRAFFLWAAGFVIGSAWAGSPLVIAVIAGAGVFALGVDLHLRRIANPWTRGSILAFAAWLAAATVSGAALYRHLYWDLGRLDPAALSARIGDVYHDLDDAMSKPTPEADLLRRYEREFQRPVERFGRDLLRRGVITSAEGFERAPKTRAQIRERAELLHRYWQCLLGTC